MGGNKVLQGHYQRVWEKRGETKKPPRREREWNDGGRDEAHENSKSEKKRPTCNHSGGVEKKILIREKEKTICLTPLDFTGGNEKAA